MNDHILHDFDRALGALKAELLAMSTGTLQNIERAMQALFQRDLDLSRAAIGDDAVVDEAEKTIDRMGMELLTRFRPVASDLRFVISSIKVSINLERISDHAVNIAKRARKMIQHQPLPEVHQLEPLYQMADRLLRDALSAFIDRNEELAKSLHARDKEIDRLHKQLCAGFRARLEESGGRSEDFLHLILVARSLERVADLAVNIGEDAVFLESAEDIRYGGRKNRPAGQEPAPDAPP
jgi:phosphate transport system protein